MRRARISRRRFTLMVGTASALPLSLAAAESLTAENVVRRIQTQLGGDWPSTGPDGFKAGDPATVVTGIATTAMATLDVLKQAVKLKTNLVLTYEPTFYGRADGHAPLPPVPGRAPLGFSPDDPIVKAKREFIENNRLTVFRLREHWQARKPDEMVAGLAAALGWSARRVKPDDALYEVPAATAEETVALIRTRLKLRGGLRVVGDRQATIRRVLLHPGSMTPATMWQRYTETDMLIAGEVREWENTHYAADSFTVGQKRALVTVGRVVSENPGLGALAAWLRSVVQEVPVKSIDVGDPYWRPA